MIISRLFLFIIILLFLFIPSSAFEDTFQYYPGGDVSANWDVEVKVGCGTTCAAEIVTSGNKRYFYIRVHDSYGIASEYAQLTMHNPYPSNYWSMYVPSVGQYQNMGTMDVFFYDEYGYEILSKTWTTTFPTAGFWEFVRDSSTGDVAFRIDGVNQGSIGTASSVINYIRFKVRLGSSSTGTNRAWFTVDDFSVNGYVVGIGTESTSHTVTELNNDATNISYTIKSFPAATFQASEYKIEIKRNIEGTYTDIQNEIVKAAGNTSQYYGYSNWNRSADLTDNDTAYGLYMVYLTEDGVSKDTDYFFFAPPGDASSISFSDTEIPIGTTQTITYSIDAADFGTYNYYVRVYSTSAQVYSTSTTVASGTVSWDTTGNDAGLYFAVLSRTHKTSGAYAELTYDVATLSENIVIRGHAYDAQNETVLANVSVNFSQASVWYNTTTNATGYYELIDIVVDVEVNVNASLVNYTHENFTFTPLATDVYTLDLYLINNTTSYNGTAIGGISYDYPLHQAVPLATVNIYNASWSNTTTSSSITGFYLFENLTNGTFTVNATKTDFQDSDEYSVDTNNGSWQTQNILMYGIYELTIRAQDATTLAYLSSFSVDYNSVVYSTTSGSIVFPNLTYGLYTFSVSADGYYSNSEDILVGSTKTETIQLTQTASQYYSPHYVKFIVWGFDGYYEGVDVAVYKYGESATEYTGVTGSDGAVTFELTETQRYTITFIDATQGINKEMTLYPVDDEYLIFIASTDTWTDYDEPLDDIVDILVSTDIINSTHAYVNVTYIDSMAETTAATVYLNQTNSSDAYNQTVIDSQGGLTNNWTHSFIVSDYESESYYIHVVATHTTYGTIDQTYTVQFEDSVSFPGIPDKAWLYIGLLIMMFTGGMFGQTTREEGAAVVCTEGWVFFFFGWFSSIDYDNAIMTGLAVATVISIIVCINKYNKKEGFE